METTKAIDIAFKLADKQVKRYRKITTAVTCAAIIVCTVAIASHANAASGFEFTNPFFVIRHWFGF